VRIRRVLVALLLVVGGVVLAGGSAAHAEESVGACIRHAFEDHPEATDEELETAAEDCAEAPNLILPATNELIWGGLSFLVLLILLWKFAYPPLKKGMEGRTERIRNEVESAEASRVEADELKERYQADLANARTEASRVIEDARATAEAMKADRLRQLDAEVAEMRQRAQADIESAKQQAIADLTDEVASLAIGAAEVVVERSLDRDTQVRLVEQYINQVGTGPSQN
jgi:F-type H+-transporting ATPase subunit b